MNERVKNMNDAAIINVRFIQRVFTKLINASIVPFFSLKNEKLKKILGNLMQLFYKTDVINPEWKTKGIITLLSWKILIK